MENNEELKPCPFCGGEAMFKTHEDSCDPSGWSSVVRCKDCHIEVWGDEDDAINKWNRRNYPEKPNLTYADVEKMVKPLEWKYAEKRELLDVYKDWKSDLFFNFYQFDIRLSSDNFKALYLHDGCGHTIPLDAGREDIENYKQTAQRFLVDLVAAALGVERSGE